MILDFPYIRQLEDYSCGSSCVQGILHYYGFDKVEEDDLISYLLVTSENGTNPKNIKKLFQKYGLNVISKKSNIDEIIENISNKIPVILNLQAWSDKEEVDYTEDYDDGHYVVAIGFENDILIFADPSHMYRTYLTHEEVNRRWHDKENENEYNNYLAIFISGRESEFSNRKFKKME